MDWRERHADQLSTAESAAKEVRSGQRLWIGMLDSTPLTFCKALLGRHAEVSDVSVHHNLSIFPWSSAPTPGAFRQTTCFSTPFDRQAVRDGSADYLPLGNFCPDHIEANHPRFDVAIVAMSPPDEHGFMSFGPALWANKTMCRLADRVFVEIDDQFIRTYGENYLHVSEVERIWPRDPSERLTLPPLTLAPELEPIASAICANVASELIRDGDCLQIGTGDVSARLAGSLGDKNDLGIQTELIPPGVIEMMERGVITGARKQIAPGKSVGSAFFGVEPEELRKAHLNPRIELWDFCHTDDLRMLIQNDCFKAVNNALQVDVTGQVAAESIGPRVYSGPGGQTTFAVAASNSRGGASIIVTPSFSMVNGERRSRIVPQLPEGAIVTVPRTFVDYVVTEHGIARLSGRTVRERIDALIAIAHPDFRTELRERARAIFAV
jgi:4-hydroxybutyrate CoA-transferase